jgi:hypothetical protein
MLRAVTVPANRQRQTSARFICVDDELFGTSKLTLRSTRCLLDLPPNRQRQTAPVSIYVDSVFFGTSKLPMRAAMVVTIRRRQPFDLRAIAWIRDSSKLVALGKLLLALPSATYNRRDTDGVPRY